MPKKPPTYSRRKKALPAIEPSLAALTPAPELTVAQEIAEVLRMKAEGKKLYAAAGSLERKLCKQLGKRGLFELPDGRVVMVRDAFARSDLAKKDVFFSRYELELVEE